MAEKFALKSWQIYDEHDGLCMKIRFKTVQEHQESTGEPQLKPIKFRKISPSQMKRDQNRANGYNLKPKAKQDRDNEIKGLRSGEGLAKEPVTVSPEAIESDCLSVSDCNIADIDCTTPPLPVKETQCGQNCDHQVSSIQSTSFNEKLTNDSNSSMQLTQSEIRPGKHSDDKSKQEFSSKGSKSCNSEHFQMFRELQAEDRRMSKQRARMKFSQLW